MALNDRQLKFINNLLKGMSQKDAYIKAGYKAKGAAAESKAVQLVRNSKVAEELKKRREKAAKKADITQERILKEESCLAFSDLALLYELEQGTLLAPHEIPEGLRRAVAGVEITERIIPGMGEKKGEPAREIKYKYKFWDKGRALDRLERIKGMFERDNDQKKQPIVINTIPVKKWRK